MIVDYFKKIFFTVFSNSPKIHRIPLGPNRGLKLFTTFNISPRMYFGFHNQWIWKLCKQYVAIGDVIYDIGAHIGFTTLIFSQKIGKDGEIHSFEVLPTVADQYLKQTINANDLGSVVTIHAVGLSNQSAELELKEGKTMMSNIYNGGLKAGKKVHCKIVKLDDYIDKHKLKPPSLMKIDVERAEIDCLLGAKATLQKYQPLLIIEFHSIKLLKEGFALLTALGYQLQTKKVVLDESYFDNNRAFYGDVFCSPINQAVP